MKFLLLSLAILCGLVSVWWIEHELSRADYQDTQAHVTLTVHSQSASAIPLQTKLPASISPPSNSAAPVDPPPKLITIKPEMPRQMWVGWGMGRFIHLPNLEPPTLGRVLSAELPEGTHLLSLNAPVTSSCAKPEIGSLDMFTDGAKEGEDGYFVELEPGKQWIQVDLGQTKEIWGIWLWHYHKMPTISKGVIIQVGTNPDGQNFTTLFNNDSDNSIGLGVGQDPLYEEFTCGRYVAGNGVSARYVRFWSCGHYEGPPLEVKPESHYIEAEIYGK